MTLSYSIDHIFPGPDWASIMSFTTSYPELKCGIAGYEVDVVHGKLESIIIISVVSSCL